MQIKDFLNDIIKKAGKKILKESSKGFDIEYKGEKDVVTNIDKLIEKFIISEILEIFPDHAILGEEKGIKNKVENAPYIWIIDPIDGTSNFSHGLPHYAVSIAIFKQKSIKKSKNFQFLEGEIILGAIYNPNTKELFFAEKNKGAFLNDKKITVSDITNIEESIFANDFPITHSELNFSAQEAIQEHCQSTRRMGSSALDLAYIACGRIDGLLSFGLKAWDIAAGVLIVNEAGGSISDTNGNLIDLFGEDILATNGHLHKKTLKILKQ